MGQKYLIEIMTRLFSHIKAVLEKAYLKLSNIFIAKGVKKLLDLISKVTTNLRNFFEQKLDISLFASSKKFYSIIAFYPIILIIISLSTNSKIVNFISLSLLYINLIVIIISIKNMFSRRARLEKYILARVEKMKSLDYSNFSEQRENIGELDGLEKIIDDIRSYMVEILKKSKFQLKKINSISEDIEVLGEESYKSVLNVISKVSDFAVESEIHAKSIEEVTHINEALVRKFEIIADLNAKSEMFSNIAFNCILEGKNSVDYQYQLMEKDIQMSDQVKDIIHQLNSAVQNIHKKIISIKDISKQTELISINATIEATRGDRDIKTFMIISGEIKKLSNNLINFSKEIIQIIQTVTNDSEKAVKSIDTLHAGLHAQKDVLDKTRELYSSIESSSKGILENIQTSNVEVLKVNDMSKEIAMRSKEISAIALNIAENTEKLSASSQSENASIEIIGSYSTKLKSHVDTVNDILNAINIK